MGLLQRLFGARETRSATSSLDVLHAMFAPASRSGQAVNWQTALRATTVLACARVLAEGVAQVPWKLFREVRGQRQPAEDHPLYPVLHRRPNPWQTSFAYRETVMLHLVLTGRHVSFVNRVQGRVDELIPLRPEDVTVSRTPDGSRSYRVVGAAGAVQQLPQEAVWHVNGPSWDGWQGLDAVRLAREAIGLGMAAEAAHADLHRNGAQASGLYSLPGTLGPEAYEKLREWIERHYSGENRFRPLILDRGATWTQSGMTGVDAQHLETRRWQVEEVCRAMRVMPIMIGHSDKATTYASAEQMFLAHVVHGLMPWYARLEQAADLDLLSAADRQSGIYTRFQAQGLLRGAARDRAAAYKDGVLTGWLTRNEVRALEELNPLDGLDEPLAPLNMGSGSEPPQPADGGGGDGRV